MVNGQESAVKEGVAHCQSLLSSLLDLLTSHPLTTPMSSPISQLLESSSPDWQAILKAVVADFFGATGTLHRLDPADGLLKLVAYEGIPDSLLPVISSIPVGKGIAGVAAERREPVELCNLQKDLGGVAKEGARSTQVQGSLAVPCLEGEALRGTLGVGMLTPHNFTEEEQQRLMKLGSEIAARLGAIA